MKGLVFFTLFFSISFQGFCNHQCKNCTKIPNISNLACAKDELKCLSRQTDQTHISTAGCIPTHLYQDGSKQCPEGSSVWQYIRNITYESCNITLRRLNNISDCKQIGLPACNYSTCTKISALSCSDFSCNISEVICKSQCDDVNRTNREVVQCSDGGLALSSQICDGVIDCFDGSDESQGQSGYKIHLESDCVVPQRNYYNLNLDQVPTPEQHWFSCLDKQLVISIDQVCDRVIDCHDLSDECLCDHNVHLDICSTIFSFNDPTNLKCFPLKNNMSMASILNQPVLINNQNGSIECDSAKGITTATRCDGIPECHDLSDECSCKSSSMFCKVDCGDLHRQTRFDCDFAIDDVKHYIKHPGCLEALQGERQCVTSRLFCKAAYFVSAQKSRSCQYVDGCEYESHKETCKFDIKGNRRKHFSSSEEMIESIALRVVFWLMAFIILIGNVHVIYCTIYLLQKRMRPSFKMNHILVLNLFISDFLMGIYLLGIAIQSANFSGYYGTADNEWRSSLLCSILGGVAVISSQASCFFISLLTAFRLSVVRRPYTAETSSKLGWKLGIVFSWILSIIIACVPVLDVTSAYFIHSIFLPDVFGIPFKSRDEFIEFSCRIASLSNISIVSKWNTLESAKQFLKENFPQYLPQREFGYYGENSVCLPDFYVEVGEQFWQYSVSLITLDFIMFIFVAIGYFCMYRNMIPGSKEGSPHNKEDAKMQKKIARLILTDFLCWIPICLVTYTQLSGIGLDKVIYPITAGALLPINSAINPILYSHYFEDKIKIPFCRKKEAENVIERTSGKGIVSDQM